MGQVSPSCVTTKAIFLILVSKFVPKNCLLIYFKWKGQITILVQVVIFLSHSNFGGWVLSKRHVNTFVKAVVLEIILPQMKAYDLMILLQRKFNFVHAKVKRDFFFVSGSQWSTTEKGIISLNYIFHENFLKC